MLDPRFDQVREAQRVFRLVLDAAAWPGKVNALPPTELRPPSPWPAGLVQLARTLLDAQVTCAVVGEGDEALTRYLALNTGARVVSPERAEYVLAGRPFERLAAREDEYPLGLDAFVVDRYGRVAALPRTTRLRVAEAAWAT